MSAAGTAEFLKASPELVDQCSLAAGPIHPPGKYLIVQACSGIAKRARFVMSHATGKIEIIGKSAGQVFMRYLQSADPGTIGKFMVFRSNPVARWLDDYRPILTEFESKKSWLF